jgi:hypothetical protein
MRRASLSLIALSVVACGLVDSEPVPGKYAVTLTLNGALCPGSTSSAGPNSQIWVIAKETSGYSLTLEDAQGNTMPFATSSDGHRFTGGGNTPPNGGCYFSINWEIDVSYDKTNITGTNTNTLSMPSSCTSNPSCSEKWDFTGTKQQ